MKEKIKVLIEELLELNKHVCNLIDKCTCDSVKEELKEKRKTLFIQVAVLESALTNESCEEKLEYLVERCFEIKEELLIYIK